MKRFLLVVAVLLMPAVMRADVADRDTLLTPSGTLYSVESAYASDYPDLTMDASNFLLFAAQDGTARTAVPLPGSLTSGIHMRPALAYDSESDTLFVFWLHIPNSMSGDLMFSSYHAGQWSDATMIDAGEGFHFRFNLRVGVTHRVSQLQADGSYADIPQLLVHAVWWEDTGSDAFANYSLIPIVHGVVGAPETHRLLDLDDSTPLAPVPVSDAFNPEILRHPAIIEGSDSVDVIFGNASTHSFSRLTLHPVSDARIHIPVGHQLNTPRVRSFSAPSTFASDWRGRIFTLSSTADGKVVLYNVQDTSVKYLVFDNNQWSAERTIETSDRISSSSAVSALTRMASSE